MISVVSEMCKIIPEIIGEKEVYFIDSSKMKQGLKYHNKEIFSPSIIAERKVDTVILTISAATIVMEIINEIKLKFPMVKRIFFAGDLAKRDFKKIKW